MIYFKNNYKKITKDTFIVSSHFNEDIRWLENYNLPVVIVSKEGGRYHHLDHDKYYNVHIAPNKLREAGSYLWFIINYWNHLPEKMFFIHGHESAHHQKLPIDKAIEKYSDCLFQDFNNYQTYHFVLSEDDSLFFDLWKQLYERRLGPIRKEFDFEHGAQFVLDRSLLKTHPLSFYRNIYDLCCHYARDEYTSYKITTFFEATWHFIFNQDFLSK